MNNVNEKAPLYFISKNTLRLMLLSLFFTILLMMSAYKIYASETAVLTVSQSEAEPGETVNVSLILENNPGIAGLLIKIEYDDSRLNLDGANAVTRGTALSNLTYVGGSESTYAHNPFSVLWYGVINDSSTGVILNVRFIVLNDASAGDAVVNVICGPNDAVSDLGKSVKISVKNAAITVNVNQTSVIHPNSGSENLPPYIPADFNEDFNEVDSVEAEEAFSYMDDNYIFEEAEKWIGENPVFVRYSDISEKDWFFEAVSLVTKCGLFEGIGDNLFAPLNEMTRAMFITVLARFDDADLSQYEISPYYDIKISTWYGPAIAWAAQIGIIDEGILSGCPEGTFKPDDSITREQMAVIFANYIRIKKLSLEKREMRDFADTVQASDWSKTAINVIRSYSIINGIGNNLYNPKGTATRAEVAQIFTNLIYAMIG